MHLMRVIHLVFLLGLPLAVFVCVLLLGVWKALPSMADRSLANLLMPAAVFFPLWAAGLVWAGWQPIQPRPYDEVQAGRKRLCFAALCAILAMVTWALWNFEFLKRPTNASGGEPHHLQRVFQVEELLAQSFTGASGSGDLQGLQADAVRTFARSPGLFEIILLPLRKSLDQQRHVLLAAFILAVVVAFWSSARLLNTHLGLVMASLIATTPLLHAFATDLYPTILAIPLLLLVGSGLYWAICFQSPMALSLAATAAGLLPLLQLNLLPVAVLTGLGCLLFIERPLLTTSARALILGATAAGPGLVAWLLFRGAGFDSGAALTHIAQQDWGSFLLLTLLHLPLPLIALACLSICRNLRLNLALALLATMCFATLLGLATAPAEHLTWSRNFALLYPLLFVLAVIGMRRIVEHRLRLYRPAQALVALTLVMQIGVGSFELNRNRLYHERDQRFDYTAFDAHLPRETTVYLNRDAPPYALLTPNFNSLKFSPLGTAPNLPTFAQRLPPAGQPWILYHVHQNRGLVHFDTVPDCPYPATLPPGFELVHQIFDPLSDGHSRVLLLRRTTTYQQRALQRLRTLLFHWPLI